MKYFIMSVGCMISYSILKSGYFIAQHLGVMSRLVLDNAPLLLNAKIFLLLAILFFILGMWFEFVKSRDSKHNLKKP